MSGLESLRIFVSDVEPKCTFEVTLAVGRSSGGWDICMAWEPKQLVIQTNVGLSDSLPAFAQA